jgi:hypothetical protein
MRSVNEEGLHHPDDVGLVYADGQVSEFEDNVVRRAADLLVFPRAIGSISSIVRQGGCPSRQQIRAADTTL